MTEPALLPKRRPASAWPHHLLACALALAMGVAQGASPAPATPPANTELLSAFGHREGLHRLTVALVERARSDARIGHFFKDVSAKHLSAQLADQFCALLSGPCIYDGEPMAQSHQSLNIQRKDFLTLVELLQQSMDAQGIAFSTQNRLLALLAPMHRDVVTP